MYIHFVCFSSLRPYGVSIPPGIRPVHVERGEEVASLDLANAVQQLADLINRRLQLRASAYNPERNHWIPLQDVQDVKDGRGVGDSGVAESVGAHCGIGVTVPPVADGEVEFLGGGHYRGCTIWARGEAGRYVPLRQGNDLYVATAGHLMREGDMCEIVCKCRGQMNTFKGECVLSYVPPKADLFSYDSLVPNVAVVKLIKPEDADIAHSFQHTFIHHGSPVHLTLPPQSSSVIPYHKRVLVFLDGDTEPIKGIVSEVLSRMSGSRLIHGKFVVQTNDPSYQLAPWTVVCLGNSVLGMVVARRRNPSGSPVVDYLVCNLRHSLDYICSDSGLYNNKTFHL